MTNSENVTGKVGALVGQAFIRRPDGTRTELHIGDPIHEGDQIVTGPGATVELIFNDNHSYVLHQNDMLVLDASVIQNQAIDSHNAAISAAGLAELNTVIASGGNLDQLIDPASAGFTAGTDANSSHSFVQLLRIVESTTTGSFSTTGGENLAPPPLPPEASHTEIVDPPTVTISALPTINAELAGSSKLIAITGTVSANVPVGDTVTLRIDGHNYSGTVQAGGVYRVDIPGNVLATAHSDSITASVSIPNGSGGVVSTTETQNYTVDLVTPPTPAIGITGANAGGYLSAAATVNATIALSAAGQATLTAGGSVQVTVDDNNAVQHLTLSLTGSGQLTDAANTIYSYANGVITLVEASPGNANGITVSATATDVNGNRSAGASASAVEYTPVTAAPVAAFSGVVNGEINSATASSGVNATITLSGAGQNVLLSGGSVQITVNDAGTVSTLNLHLDGAQNLVDAGNHPYSYSNGVITLSEAAPGNGQSISLVATETDVTGLVSASATVSATEIIPTAPNVVINDVVNGVTNTINGASATIGISPADVTLLNNGGSITISTNGNPSAAMHLSGGTLVDGNNVPIAGVGFDASTNSITVTEPAGASGTLTVAATVTDVYGNGASGLATATEYSAAPLTNPTVSINGASTGSPSYFNDASGTTSTSVSINIGASDAIVLANGGQLIVSNNGVAGVALHLDAAGNLVNASDTVVGSVTAGPGGAETLVLNAEAVPAAGTEWAVSAQVTDAFQNTVTGSTSTYVYTPVTSAPFVAISGAANGELNSATTGPNVNATVTLDSAGMASLQTSGSVQITVVDAGVTQNLLLHLNGSGALVDASGTIYPYSGGVITLNEAAPNTGNSLSVTAAIIDAGGLTSASSTATAAEYTPVTSASPAPIVAIPAAPANVLTNAILDGAPTVTATITLSTAQQNTLTSGGTMQVTVVDAGVTQHLNLFYNGTAVVDTLGHTYGYAGGVVSLTQAVPGNGNTITVTAALTDVAGHSTSTGTASASETITLPDTPTVALLANGLTGNYYGVTESQISSPPAGYTALEEVDAYLLTKAVAGSTTVPTAFPGAIIAPATASFIATEINYGLNTTSTSPTISNEPITNNLGTLGNLAKWLDVTGSSGPYATNYQNQTTVSTNQAIITMSGVIALPTLPTTGPAQEYALKIFADDGYQVYIDGVQVATVPANQSGKADFFYFTAPATAGNLHTIQILYWDQGGATSIQASLGTILTSNVPANSTTVPTLVTPLSILTPAMIGEVTATVQISSANQTILNNGGTVLISESNGTNLVLHQNSSGNIVDASGLRYTYIGNVIYIPVATSSGIASISATVVDQYSYASGTAFTGPAISIASDANHNGYLNISDVAGESTAGHILANVSLNTLMLTGTGSATITVLDNGVSTTLNVASSGTITGTTANVAATYSAGVVAITLLNPGNGNSATISATQTDAYGHTSTTATSTVLENINVVPAAPVVAIASDANHDGYLSAPELNGSSTVSATITLNSAAQTTLSNGGTVQINVSDNGSTETLNLHLNGSGVLVNAAGISSAEYSYASGVITLTEPAPGNGHSIAISATTTDIAGNASAVSNTATAIQDVLDTPTVMTLGTQHATVTLDAANQTVLATTGSTLHVTASDGTNLTLHENSSGQLVDAGSAIHSYANGIVPLNLLNDVTAPVVTVSATLTDSHGVNSFTSSATLVNSGNNSLTELAGGDTFVFALSANGTPGAAHVDTISAFNSNAAASGGDVLNLADLLTGISPSATAATLSNYLHFSEVSNGSGGQTTTLHVSSGGGFSGGFTAGQETLQIVLTNSDLLHSAGVSLSDTQIIQSLLNQHKLVE